MAAKSYGDDIEAERYLHQALAMAPEHAAVYIAFYRFYFYPNRVRQALPYAELCLGLDGQCSECRLIEDGQIGQNLAVDFDVGLLQTLHEGAVLHAFQTGGGIDTGDPQGTELTLALTTVTVLVLTGLHHRLLGNAIYVLAPTAVTLGLVENLLVPRARRYTTPEACAITTTALDHQEHLGTTEEAIGFEKAGIIKAGVPVVVGRIDGPPWDMIRNTAADRGAPLTRLGVDFHADGTGQEEFSYCGRSRQLDGLTCALTGRHQLNNAACAVALLEAAEGRGISVPDGAVRRGLESVVWEGRLEVVERGPVLLLDGAHNPAAAHVLVEYLTEWRASRPESRVILVLGMMRDKDHARFVEPFCRLVSEVVLTQADMPRSATVQELRETIGSRFSLCHVAPGAADALALAKARATAKDLICATGSLMLVGEVKALVRGCGLSPLRG